MTRWIGLLIGSALAATAVGCGDDTGTSTSGSDGGAGSGAGDQGGGTTVTTGESVGGGGSSAQAGGGGSGGGGGGGAAACTATATEGVRGAAVAISEDDGLVVAANRDSGTVSIFSTDLGGALPSVTKTSELAVGNGPWQVAIDPCGTRAFVVVREDQKVVAIDGLDTTPVVGAAVAVGSEPTAIALSPNGTTLYVASWVDGTVSVIDVATLTVSKTVDLNATLAATGLLGDSVASPGRPAIAHPRSIAITNDGDADDTDETIVVTEFFAQRTAPEASGGGNVDSNWAGVLYRFDAATATPSVIELDPLVDAGFSTSLGQAGCFPNQLQSVTVRGDRAYVTSICASPRGPTIPKAMTYPLLSVVDLAQGEELPASPVNLAKSFDLLYEANGVPATSAARRYPLVANDVAFDPVSGAAYVTANGVDAVFRVLVDDASGGVVGVGAGASKPFIDLAPSTFAAGLAGQNPNGIAMAHGAPYAFVINDVSRNLSVVDVDPGAQAVAGASTPVVVQSSALPTAAEDLARLAGKRAFDTGLDRFSQDGQGWGACQSCHFEGLSDNVTWYLGKGPRQSTSLDGSFASGDPTDQRIFNWTAVNDEIGDFEAVLRSLDGGVGGMVHTVSSPAVMGDRIDAASTTLFPSFGAAGLNGTAEAVQQMSVLQTWNDVRAYIQAIRSPKKPSNLDPAKVAAGASLFSGAGGCQGCHGGAKWTISQRFYTPSSSTDEALKTTAWDGAAIVQMGFPAELLPATAGNQFMRFAGGGGDQIQCVLRPVGTFAVAPADVGVLEVTANMTSTAQGGDPNGNGYNVPSLLGLAVGAPYFHAGNARTLEELLDDVFATHREALAATGFLDGANAATDKEALIQYLLSIDESTQPVSIPSLGAQGGVFCAAP